MEEFYDMVEGKNNNSPLNKENEKNKVFKEGNICTIFIYMEFPLTDSRYK